MNSIKVFTDGACSGNPGPGGWGAIIKNDGDDLEISGGAALTTNNRMEMTAPIEALKFVYEKFPGHPIEIFSDSQYLVNGITSWVFKWEKNGWKTASKGDVENQDLWTDLLALSRAPGAQISWHWVRGHAGHVENERADMLARKALIATSIDSVSFGRC